MSYLIGTGLVTIMALATLRGLYNVYKLLRSPSGRHTLARNMPWRTDLTPAELEQVEKDAPGAEPMDGIESLPPWVLKLAGWICREGK